MNEQDRQAIEGLFSKLAQAERQAGPRDAEAEALIQQHIARQPGAPYVMAQTIVMQNFALEQAQQRIQELEQQVAENEDAPANAGGGMFGGLFGGGRQAGPARRAGSVPATGRPMGGPAGMPMQHPQAGGGGFLAGAAQTAMGVAGGVLLANAIGGMFGGGDAQAAPAADAAAPAQDAAAQPEPAAPEPEPAAEDGGGGFFDSIFGGGGDEF